MVLSYHLWDMLVEQKLKLRVTIKYIKYANTIDVLIVLLSAIV